MVGWRSTTNFRYQVTKRDWVDGGYAAGDNATEAFEALLSREGDAMPIGHYVAEKLPEGTVEEIAPSALSRRSAKSS